MEKWSTWRYKLSLCLVRGIQKRCKMTGEELMEKIESKLAFVSVLGTSNYIKALSDLKRYRELQ